MSDDVVQDRHVSEYVTRIGESGVFGKSKRRLRLLEHLLQSHIHGADDELKAYSIGLDVFDKSDDFDPSTDSIVRVEMGRLRNALALFEASDLQRRFRDAHAMTQHIVTAPSTWELTGRLFFDLPTDASMI